MELKDTGKIREYSMKFEREVNCPLCGRVNDLKDIFDSPDRKVDFNEKKEFSIKCMGCDEWFMPQGKKKPKENVAEIYLFQSCSCGYNFDFRYPADEKRLRLTPIFDVPFAVCPKCDHVLIFPTEKRAWRFWILAIYITLWLFYDDLINCLNPKRND